MVSVQTATKFSVFEGLQAEQVWEASKMLGYPSAMWRLPHANEIKLLISLNKGVQQCQPDFEKLSPGFMISEFKTNADDLVHYLEGDIILTYLQKDSPAQVDNHLGEEHIAVKKLVELAQSLSQKSAESADQNPFKPIAPDSGLNPKERFERIVELAVSAIRQNRFKKVVLSRTKDFTYPKDFLPAKAFTELAASYPHAFVSLVNLPEQNEMWLGASPELLVQQTSDGTFRTMSLAGTQNALSPAGTLIPKYEVRWNEKEIEEQALVSRYIVECFKKIRLREYIETGPKTVLAGNLYHLKTDFEVDATSLNFPELGSVMLKLLHPTSAVCGVPKAPSLEFLLEMEGYDRSFYSGYLGPTHINETTSMFVNLRNVRFKEGIATFFAGAGITEDSIPAQEWIETELKCETLLKVIAPVV